MHSQPIFIHSIPVPSDSAVVLLSAGDWSIESNHEDSVLNLSVNGIVYRDIKNGQVIKVEKQSPARASIVVAGKEKQITLSLVKGHGVNQ